MDLSNFTQIVTPNSSIAVSNIQVSGTSTTVSTTDLLIEDNKVVLNSTAPSALLDASIIVNRGTDANVAIKWSESLGKWQQTRDGSTYVDIPFNTSELREDSSSLYFTNSRANAAIASYTGNLQGNLSYSKITDLPIVKVSFAYNASSPRLIATIPANALVSKVEVYVITSFNDNNTTLTLGSITNTTELVDLTDTKLSTVGLYTTLPGMLYMSDTQIVLTVNSGTSNTGSGIIIIYY